MEKLELLAPARSLDLGKTAIDYGADALYVGGPGFGARAAAGNSVEDVARLVEYARPFGVRVYAALNTLVFEDELAAAEKTARGLIDAGVDALIVQDMAFMRMGLEGVEFHASTQMCNASPEQVRFLQEAGFARVILERGLTLDEIKAARAATTVGLECFVHGAICVGYSGRCYMSRSMGPRSGNRGDCMQACRLPYDLVDERGEILIKSKHLLSVKDLALADRIPQLLDAGVDSFKIEGRLKDTNYVKNVVAYHRRVLDDALKSRKDCCVKASSGSCKFDFKPNPKHSFSRGFTHWMLDGKQAGAAAFDTPKAVGTYVGKVVEMGNQWIELDGNKKFNPGDGLCWTTTKGTMGGNVNCVYHGRTGLRRLGLTWTAGLKVGTEVFRNRDHLFWTSLERSKVRRSIGATGVLTSFGDGLELVVTDVDGNVASSAISGYTIPGNNQQLMEEVACAQISRSGNSMFDMTDVRFDANGHTVPFIPVSALNSLRREVLDMLVRRRLETYDLQRVAAVLPQENMEYLYPGETLGGEANVVNSLAEKFYRDHGVGVIESGFDMRESQTGVRVMTTSWCLRRELGQCLAQPENLKPEYGGELYLEHGVLRYRLGFDCARCMMNVVAAEDKAPSAARSETLRTDKISTDKK